MIKMTNVIFTGEKFRSSFFLFYRRGSVTFLLFLPFFGHFRHFNRRCSVEHFFNACFSLRFAPFFIFFEVFRFFVVF